MTSTKKTWAEASEKELRDARVVRIPGLVRENDQYYDVDRNRRYRPTEEMRGH